MSLPVPPCARAILAVILLFTAGACEPVSKPAPPPPIAPMSAETQKFFVDWLKSHGEENVVVDARGVGLAGNTTRLRAALYEAKEARPGSWSAEMEFRVALPSGQEIVEYVAGLGEDKSQAQNDSMVNFVLTTFHVVYKSFMNPSDPHQTIRSISVDGRPRELLLGDLYLRGEKGIENPELSDINERLREAVAQQHLSPGPHWFKVVYGQRQGKPMMIAATRDNLDDLSLLAAIKALPWPAAEGFYMAKEFMVIK